MFRSIFCEPQNSQHCVSWKFHFLAQIKSNDANNATEAFESDERHKYTPSQNAHIYKCMQWMLRLDFSAQIALWMHNLQQPTLVGTNTNKQTNGEQKKICYVGFVLFAVYLTFAHRMHTSIFTQHHSSRSLAFAVCGWIGQITESAEQFFIVNVDSGFRSIILSHWIWQMLHIFHSHQHNTTFIHSSNVHVRSFYIEPHDMRHRAVLYYGLAQSDHFSFSYFVIVELWLQT